MVASQAAVIALVGSAVGIGYNALADGGVFAAGAAHAGATVVSLAEARQAFEAGEAVFVDARFRWDYAEGHVPGARNVPVGQFEAAEAVLGDLEPETWIITYCTGAECHSSHTLARVLREKHGFQRVQVMEAGWPGWEGAGYPVAREGLR